MSFGYLEVSCPKSNGQFVTTSANGALFVSQCISARVGVGVIGKRVDVAQWAETL